MWCESTHYITQVSFTWKFKGSGSFLLTASCMFAWLLAAVILSFIITDNTYVLKQHFKAFYNTQIQVSDQYLVWNVELG